MLVLTKENVFTSNNFEDFLLSLQNHSCKKDLIVFLEDKTMKVTCQKCAALFSITLGKTIHTVPDHIRWMVHSHEGRLIFIKELEMLKVL